MTEIKALLERLKKVDPETYDVIGYGMQSVDIELEEDIIQGCIQRAIVEKGWKYVVSNDRARQPYGQIGIPISNVRTEYQHRNYADSPAAAILAAYIEAVRARQ